MEGQVLDLLLAVKGGVVGLKAERGGGEGSELRGGQRAEDDA